MKKEFSSAKELHHYIASAIAIYDQAEANAIGFIILNHFNISRTDVLSDKKISFSQNEKLEEIITRINQHEPVQYILGETTFYGLKFIVSPAVLIPRPETEELVDLIIQDNRDKKNLKILDIGTGSGCIPVSIAKNLQSAEVYAMDISKEALAVAKENSWLNDVTINFLEQDIIQDSTFKISSSGDKHNLDIIVSNPPYVRETEKKEMQKNVLKFEPSQALFVPDDNPLLFYEVILDFATKHLCHEGKCYFEINEAFGEEMKILMTRKGFWQVKIISDIHGKNRFAVGELIR
ncbi:MAG: peptide chain release factor N(5)-glutamine methyltransferase [Cytophagaceae bacterium]|nr:peptide chain release factor N(5)-glutamine methyltransferase [Cytophagaceae bacterium]